MSLLDDENIIDKEFYINTLKNIPSYRQPIHIQAWYNIILSSVKNIIENDDYDLFIKLINMYYKVAPKLYMYKSGTTYQLTNLEYDPYTGLLLLLDVALDKNKEYFKAEIINKLLASYMANGSTAANDIVNGVFEKDYIIKGVSDESLQAWEKPIYVVKNTYYEEYYNMILDWIELEIGRNYK